MAMEGIEQSLNTAQGSNIESKRVGAEFLLQYRSFSVAPAISINTAAMALTDRVLKNGLQSLVSLQSNVKTVTRILYEDGHERQPYTSRTLACISFQLCNAIAKVNEDLARKLCHALVAEAFTGLRVAWIVSNYLLSKFRTLIKTGTKLRALGL